MIELKHSDKQIVNELVYRWCRILTRSKFGSKKVLIMDMIGAVSLTRLAVVLKEDEKRMFMIDTIRQCKINSTFITMNSYFGPNSLLPKSVKLIVIYQDEFYINKTLELLQQFLPKNNHKVLLVVPGLNRSERDLLNLSPANQILKCGFQINRRDIGPALAQNDESYQKSLNKVYFRRELRNKASPEVVHGQLTEDGLCKDDCPNQPPIKKLCS